MMPAALARDITLQTRCRDAAFIAGWEIQGHLSTLTFVALLGLGSLVVATLVTLAWSIVMTVVYHRARLDGRPDLLEQATWHHGSSLLRMKLMGTAWTVVKAWLAGFQAFAYSRTFGRTLQVREVCMRRRLVRIAVLALGLTLFGVPTAHHLLSKAGYEDAGLLGLGFVAAVLHVSYRAIVGGVIAGLTLGVQMPWS
jgi:hypothetical protein